MDILGLNISNGSGMERKHHMGEWTEEGGWTGVMVV